MNKLFLIALFVVAVFWFVRWQGSQYKDFIAQSDKTSGVILKKEEVVMRNDQPNRTDHYITYSYNVDGKEYIGREVFEFDEYWSEVQEGQAANVSYLRTDPAKSHLTILLEYRAK